MPLVEEQASSSHELTMIESSAYDDQVGGTHQSSAQEEVSLQYKDEPIVIMNTVETAQVVDEDEYTTDLQILEDPSDDQPNLTHNIRQ